MAILGRRLLASLLALSVLSSVGLAATISGRVRDSNTNAYILGATVTVRELGRSTTTSSGGEFYFANLPAGIYTIDVSSLGFESFSRSLP